eukprot:Pompholyxophrys_punicea_v1_NODE_236_length_2608_cov_7.122601.p2 type:complete len:168 gc:universal NODE_236_length_2608_cov_7.122601:1468-965(-)
MRSVNEHAPLVILLIFTYGSKQEADYRNESELKNGKAYSLDAAKTSQSQTWKLLNELRGKPVASALPPRLKDETSIISSPLEIANHLNEFFATVGSTSQAVPMRPVLLDSLPTAPILRLPTCTPADVQILIQELKNSRSLDSLGVHTAFLKDGAELSLLSPASLISL